MITSEENTKQLRVAIYGRVSTEEQSEGHKIDSQIAELERFVRDKDWVIQSIYKDDGWSGAALARPELDRLRDDAGKGLFDAVIVNDVDRLARDVAHLGIIKRDFESKRIQLIFKKLPGKSSPTYNLMVNILGSFAEFERELITDRTRRGRRHKAEVRNQFVGCVAPYGYYYETGSGTDGNEPIIRIIPTEAKVVVDIYEWASVGVSMTKIARRLDEMAIPTRKGRPRWSATTIMNILRSEVYTGTWSYCKKEAIEPKKRRTHQRYPRQTKTSRLRRPKSEWLRVTLPTELRLIAPEFWSKVQDRINHNRKFSPRNSQHFYLLQGLLSCAYCGASCSGTFKVSANGNFRFYYRCWKRCEQSLSTRTDVLDSRVWSALRDALSNPSRLLERIVEAKREMANEAAMKEVRTEKLAETNEAESRLFQGYQAGTLSPSQLATALELLNAKRAQITAEEVDETKQSPKNTLDRPLQETCRLFAKQLEESDMQMRRDILRRLNVEASVTTDRVKIRAKIPRELSNSPTVSDGGIASSSSRESECNSPQLAFELTVRLQVNEWSQTVAP